MVITIKCEQGNDIDVLVNNIINNSKSLSVKPTDIIIQEDKTT